MAHTLADLSKCSFLFSETVVCKWCGRSFSRKAAERHVPFCEKWTKDHGRPQSPTHMYNTKSKSDRAREVSNNVFSKLYLFFQNFPQKKIKSDQLFTKCLESCSVIKNPQENGSTNTATFCCQVFNFHL